MRSSHLLLSALLVTSTLWSSVGLADVPTKALAPVIDAQMTIASYMLASSTVSGSDGLAPASIDVPPLFAGPLQWPTHLDRVVYTVHFGDDARRMRQMWGVTMRDLRRMNPGTKRFFRPGQKLVVYERPKEFTSTSWGRPSRGHLEHGVPMPDGVGWIVKQRHRSFGTQQTVELLMEALYMTRMRFPGAHDVAIGDISYPRGARISPHKSHQSGRDVDLGMYLLEDPEGHWARANPDNFDAEKTFFLIEQLLLTEKVTYIFADRWVQKALVTWALGQGYEPDKLADWFQVPVEGASERREPPPIVRHERGHRDHLHIRFKCDADDHASCR